MMTDPTSGALQAGRIAELERENAELKTLLHWLQWEWFASNPQTRERLTKYQCNMARIDELLADTSQKP